jgi:hypothetical protein
MSNKYQFQSKSDEIYFNNYLDLVNAIEKAGGNGRFVIDRIGGELLDILARNSILINPIYVGLRINSEENESKG